MESASGTGSKDNDIEDLLRSIRQEKIAGGEVGGKIN